jgi:hypothetical protein
MDLPAVCGAEIECLFFVRAIFSANRAAANFSSRAFTSHWADRRAEKLPRRSGSWLTSCRRSATAKPA